MPQQRPAPTISIAATLIVACFASAPEATACVGPGTMVNGRMTGVDLSNCGGGNSTSYSSSGGSISSEIEGAAAAVQLVGIAAGLLGNLIDNMPKATLEMPRIQLPTPQLPSVQMPSMQMPSAAPPANPPTSQAPPPQDARAASCARLARIYKASRAKMLTATQHLDDVNNSHPEKLCEFGRDVGVPLLMENVNAVSAARGEVCFGPEDQKRLASFKSLLEDERHAFAIDCKRAIDAEGASPTAQNAAQPSPSTAQVAYTHQAPGVPVVPQVATSGGGCSTITESGVNSSGPANCGSNGTVNISGGSSPPPSWSPQKVQQVQAQWANTLVKYKIAYNALPSQIPERNKQIAAIALALKDIANQPDMDDLWALLNCMNNDYDCLLAKLDKVQPDGSQPPTGNTRKPPTAIAKADDPSAQPDAEPACEKDYLAPPDSGVKICWQHANNGYCKKWRQDSKGNWLRTDGTDDSFSDHQVNIGFTQPCPEDALPIKAKALNSSKKTN